jgi:hypothetical protein
MRTARAFPGWDTAADLAEGAWPSYRIPPPQRCPDDLRASIEDFMARYPTAGRRRFRR